MFYIILLYIKNNILYKKTNIIIIVIISILVSNCFYDNDSNNKVKRNDTTLLNNSKLNEEIDTLGKNKDTTDLERILIKAGLVNINKFDTSIKIDIRYSTTNNFLGIDMYGDFDKAYLQKETAEKLHNAQKLIQKKHPKYCLIVFDAARPRTIQKLMWDSIKIQENQKHKYLANPKYISMHSYGLAVDLSIVDSSGKELDMGTDFDSFEELAYPALEEQMLKNGLLSETQYNNRLLLRNTMDSAGFNSITTEWWHFSIYSKAEAKKLFAAIETHILPSETSDYIAEIPEEIDLENINVFFKVQLKTSMKPIDVNSSVFKGLEIFRYYHQGLYKYTAGKFKDIASAYKYRDEIKSMGYNDCFVAGFNNDQRIGIRDAVELSQ